MLIEIFMLSSPDSYNVNSIDQAGALKNKSQKQFAECYGSPYLNLQQNFTAPPKVRTSIFQNRVKLRYVPSTDGFSY